MNDGGRAAIDGAAGRQHILTDDTRSALVDGDIQLVIDVGDVIIVLNGR